MGKRSNFHRRPMDDYATPHKAVVPLLPFLEDVWTYVEPCCGAGDLVDILSCYNYHCTWQSDIRMGRDALTLDERAFAKADAIITNPPWTWELLEPLLKHFLRFKPTWLILSADFAHNLNTAPFIDCCTHIVSVGRVKWQPGSKSFGKDNVAWFRFEPGHHGGPHFYHRDLTAKLQHWQEEAAE